MLFVDVFGPDGTRTLAFPVAELTIGSGADTDIRLEDSSLAERHIGIVERGGEPVLVPLGPTTQVNGNRIADPIFLEENHIIGLGKFRLRFRTIELPPDTLQVHTKRMPHVAPSEGVIESAAPVGMRVPAIATELLPPVPSSGSAPTIMKKWDPTLSPEANADVEIPPRSDTTREIVASKDPIEQEFLRAIVEEAESSDARAVYADWLEENGESKRADYMRKLVLLHEKPDPAALVGGVPRDLRRLSLEINRPWRAKVAPYWTEIERCSFENDCPKTWGALKETGVDDVRSCMECGRLVSYASDSIEARFLATRSDPVVVDPVAMREAGDLDPYISRWDGIVIGRRPDALSPASCSPLNGSVSTFFAECSALEAAAVTAFEVLARDLDRLGAPVGLRRRALEAAVEETRHARAMEALADHFGDARVRHRGMDEAQPLRPQLAIAIENMVEGCVRETYGAEVASWQASHAQNAAAKRVLMTIASEEESHAQLSFDIAAWLTTQLSESEREAVKEAQTRALAELDEQMAVTPSQEVQSLAGYPDAKAARVLLSRVRARNAD